MLSGGYQRVSGSGAVILYGTVLIAVLVVDQLTKWWIVNTFGLYESREVVAGLFNLVYVTNKGAAFSLFATIDSPLRHYFFVTVNLIALSVLTIAAFKMRAERWYLLSFGLISGGALGNLVDRLRYGAVVDFLDFYLGSYHWPAFNVADSAIFCGVGLLLVLTFKKPQTTTQKG
jgi:signal peptidase II